MAHQAESAHGVWWCIEPSSNECWADTKSRPLSASAQPPSPWQDWKRMMGVTESDLPLRVGSHLASVRGKLRMSMSHSKIRQPDSDSSGVRVASVEARPSRGLRDALDDYHKLKDLSGSRDDAARMAQQPVLVSRFYDVVTRFYEFGWGSTFHFSPRRPGENLAAPQRRHDREIGALLRLKPHMEVADLGCGVGGPMITIARATGASITGINFNAYQIAQGEQRVAKAGLDKTCRFLFANFMHVPLEDAVFDAIYAFESVCHAPNNLLLFGELYRLLKPGGEIAIVDWCFTDRYDGADPRHRDIRDRIETTNAVPKLLTTEQEIESVRNAGFEIIQAVDQQAADGDPRAPWYMALQGRDLSLSSLARIPAGRRVTATVTKLLERLRVDQRSRGFPQRRRRRSG